MKKLLLILTVIVSMSVSFVSCSKTESVNQTPKNDSTVVDSLQVDSISVFDLSMSADSVFVTE